MLTWNYRVLRRESGGTSYYELIEAYYDDHEQSEVTMWCARTEPGGESLEELKADLAHMKDAVEVAIGKPRLILTLLLPEDFPEEEEP